MLNCESPWCKRYELSDVLHKPVEQSRCGCCSTPMFMHRNRGAGAWCEIWLGSIQQERVIFLFLFRPPFPLKTNINLRCLLLQRRPHAGLEKMKVGQKWLLMWKKGRPFLRSKIHCPLTCAIQYTLCLLGHLTTRTSCLYSCKVIYSQCASQFTFDLVANLPADTTSMY